ncbi:hypothetical protein FRC19_006196 [Serendipita sp. 401]|nr:hypothetical protein FRC19_006196 [Serendipita sp. 401]
MLWEYARNYEREERDASATATASDSYDVVTGGEKWEEVEGKKLRVRRVNGSSSFIMTKALSPASVGPSADIERSSNGKLGPQAAVERAKTVFVYF